MAKHTMTLHCKFHPQRLLKRYTDKIPGFARTDKHQTERAFLRCPVIDSITHLQCRCVELLPAPDRVRRCKCGRKITDTTSENRCWPCREERRKLFA